jgi:hypothetical protein
MLFITAAAHNELLNGFDTATPLLIRTISPAIIASEASLVNSLLNFYV